MNTYNTHKHHIIPKYAGGSDDPSNIVELTVEDHAIAHLVRYRIYGNWQDLLAWNGLSGRMSHEDIVRKAIGAATKNKSYEQIHGDEKGKELRKVRAQQMTRLRKGKSWDEIFGEEKTQQRKERRGIKCSCTICKKEISVYQFNNHLRKTHRL